MSDEPVIHTMRVKYADDRRAVTPAFNEAFPTNRAHAMFMQHRAEVSIDGSDDSLHIVSCGSER